MGAILGLYMWHDFTTCELRFRYKAFRGILTTGRPLAGPYSDICDVAAACVKDLKKILDNLFTQ